MSTGYPAFVTLQECNHTRHTDKKVLLILLFIVNIAVYCYLLRKPLEDHLICFTIIDALSIGSA